MKRCWILAVIAVSLAATAGNLASAADGADKREATAEQLAYFEKQVRPLLISRCMKCHGDEKVRGGLRLDSRDAFLAGGDSGEVFDPEAPGDSLFLEAINYDSNALVQMPPDGKLPDAEIAVLAKWIRDGAAWPESKVKPKPTTEDGGELFTAEEKSFWAFQPVVKPALPDVANSDWSRDPLDRFVLAQLEEQGLTPAPEADKRDWLRRATFDLCGLPPTPQEMADFLADDSPEAYSRVIDRLLASPRYGERWGRHWLDVARYADSNGMDENMAYANAFRYRDYVIAAINKDKPFDLFIREQIAGDLMPAAEDPAVTVEQQTATAFLAIGPKMLAEDDPVKMRVDIVDEQIDTIGRAFMGMTLGCARCHDHKFDPIPQADYYSLAGIFLSTKTMENYKVVANWYERPLADPAVVAQVKLQEQKIAEHESAVAAITREQNQQLVKEARARVGDYLLAGTELLRHRAAHQSLVPQMAAAAEALPAGCTVVEAEDFARGNVKKDFETYGQKIGVVINAGPLPNFVEYEFDIPDAETMYQLEFRVAAAESRPVKLSVNGKPHGQPIAETVTGSWTPDSQKWQVAALVKFQPGKNVVRLERDGPFPHFDKLAIVPIDAATRPLTVGELAAQHQLTSTFVEQWADYLDRTKTDENSPLAQWHALVASQAEGGGLFDEFHRESRQRLAARYQELFAAADAAWKELKQSDGGKEAKQLADAQLESFRQIVHNRKDGPFAVSETLERDFPADAVAELKTKRDAIKSLKDSMPQLPQGMGVTEDEIQNARINIRGNHINLGDEVPRQFPRIMAGEDQQPLAKATSGRLQLAEWLTSPTHPLTSRVIVNRIWRWHFGEGIVPTPDNFGTTGSLPVNQPLLDYLAAEFVESGWGLKDLHRRIMLSSTYRMSTRYDEAAAAKDPENKFLWRMNRRRLSAEEIRDAMLSVAGNLDVSMGGTLLPTKNHTYVNSTTSVAAQPYQTPRRSVYLPVIRSGLFEMFQAFDFPDPSFSSGDRATTTVAPQALFLLNSDFVDEQTAEMARELLNDPEADDAALLAAAYRRALGREPRDDERQAALAFLTDYQTAIAERVTNAPDRRRQAWQGLCRVLFSSSEFLYVD